MILQKKVEHPLRLKNKELIAFMFTLAHNDSLLASFLVMVQYLRDNPHITLRQVQTTFDQMFSAIKK